MGNLLSRKSLDDPGTVEKAHAEFGYDHQKVHGITYPPFIREHVVDALRRDFVSRPGDVFVSTYPKAGTTWMQRIVLLLLHGGDASMVEQHPALQKQAPWLDASYHRVAGKMAGPRPYLTNESLEAMETPRVFKTHAPWHLFPVSEGNLDAGTKIVYVARNVKDCAVSLFHHSMKIPAHGYDGNWEHFFELFMNGGTESGDWFDYNTGWHEAKQGPKGDQIIWVNFEDLKENPAQEIARIAEFLGCDTSPDLIDRVVEESSFGAMKKAAEKTGDQSAEATSRFRKGGSGGWRELFTDEQSAEVDAIVAERMAGVPCRT